MTIDSPEAQPMLMRNSQSLKNMFVRSYLLKLALVKWYEHVYETVGDSVSAVIAFSS